MQKLALHASFSHFLHEQACHSLPLAEHHCLAAFDLQHVAEYVRCLVDFHVVAHGLIHNECAVAHHAHHVEASEQYVAVFLSEEFLAVPFPDEHCHSVFVLVVHIHLLLRHRHEQVGVLPLGELHLHVNLAAANEAAAGYRAYFVELFVANNL